MATIKPFTALRYTQKAGDIQTLVAPPYDVIDDARRAELAAQNPYNIVKLILPEDAAGSTKTEAKYADTARRLETWLADGILAKEESPAYYIYSQTFTVDGVTHVRTGFMGACLLEKFGEGSVFPHEKTLAGPKVDRLKLTQATQTQLSQIFGLYPDPDKTSVDHMAAIMNARPADLDFVGEYGREQVWIVTDPAEQKPLSDAVSSADGIYIADGHHRYETAYGYSNDVRREKNITSPRGEIPTDYVLMVCVPMEDPGLIVLPTHRVVYGTPDEKAAALLDAAGEHFDIVESDDEAIISLTEATDGPVRFGLAAPGGKRFILTLKNPAVMDARAPEKSANWRGLDVAVLHLLLLEDLLGIDAAKLERKENITYVKSTQGTLDMIESGDAKNQWAFLCRPTRIDQLKAVADHGEVMPQKSTFFYPKLLAGVVLRPVSS